MTYTVQKEVVLKIIDVILPKRCLGCATLCTFTFCDFCHAKISIAGNNVGKNRSLFVYSSIVRDLILKAKFAPDEGIARALARFMICRLNRYDAFFEDEQFNCITYVPTPWSRRVIRGFDFPLLLAQAISRNYNIPLFSLLSCHKSGEPLSTLTTLQERREQIQERFRLKTTLRNFNSVLLVDDIRTTGTTAEACLKLIRPLAHEVSFFSLAKV